MYKRTQWKLAALLLVAPALLFGLFLIYPSVQAFYISLFNWRGVSSYKVYVGLSNYQIALSDSAFLLALRNNLAFVFLGGGTTLIVGFFLAVVLSRKVPGHMIYRVIYFFPYTLSLACIAVLWVFMYHPTFGAVNSIMRAIGLSSLTRVWLGDQNTALIAVIAVMVWGAFGFYMMFFLGAIQRIPSDYYDAARVDGANELQMALRVTLPLCWEHIKAGVVILSIRGLNEFVLVQVMTQGAPAGSTEVVSTYLYRMGFWYSKFGLATAMAVILSLVSAGFILVSQRILLRETIEY